MSADGAGGGAAQGLVRRTRPAIPAPGRRLPAGAALVLSLWAVATSVNLLKPFHIDDAAHLLIAEWIASNPLRPMSGMLNWGDIAEPIFIDPA